MPHSADYCRTPNPEHKRTQYSPLQPRISHKREPTDSRHHHHPAGVLHRHLNQDRVPNTPSLLSCILRSSFVAICWRTEPVLIQRPDRLVVHERSTKKTEIHHCTPHFSAHLLSRRCTTHLSQRDTSLCARQPISSAPGGDCWSQPVDLDTVPSYSSNPK